MLAEFWRNGWLARRNVWLGWTGGKAAALSALSPPTPLDPPGQKVGGWLVGNSPKFWRNVGGIWLEILAEWVASSQWSNFGATLVEIKRKFARKSNCQHSSSLRFPNFEIWDLFVSPRAQILS